MKRLLLAVICLCQPAAAYADWSYVQWGMTQQQVIAASRGNARAIDEDDRRYGWAIAETTVKEGEWTFDVQMSGYRVSGFSVKDFPVKISNIRFGVKTNCEALLPYLRKKYKLLSEGSGGDTRFIDGTDEIRYHPFNSTCSFRRFKRGAF